MANEPSTLLVALRLGLVILIGALLPQGLGLLGSWFVRCRRRWAKAAVIAIPPVVFFMTSITFWRVEAAAIEATGGRACGLFGAMAVFSTLGGSGIHLVLAIGLITFANYSWPQRSRVLPANDGGEDVPESRGSG